jgi:predicted nuclease of restriction endonuclease-like RecB superfamily
LPDLQQVERVPEWAPQEFLGRYNLALLQALFFRAEKLVLTCKKPSMPDLRRFGRALKFHKLLATGKNEGDTWHFEISGPLAAHLDQAQVYGMHFVRLIPAILRLPRFEVELSFDWQDKTAAYTFTEALAKGWALDKQGTGYYPEELDASLEQLKDQLDATYQLQTSQEMLTFPDGSTCIPDWTIVQQGTGETVHVELFHRWHQDAFQKRLQQLQSGTVKQRLVIGACRSLTKQKSVERWLKDFPNWDQIFGFSFRDFPTAEQLQGGIKQGLSQR